METRNAKVFTTRVSLQVVAEIKCKESYQQSLKCYPGHKML